MPEFLLRAHKYLLLRVVKFAKAEVGDAAFLSFVSIVCTQTIEYQTLLDAEGKYLVFR